MIYICFKIFLARIVDVSIGTIRTVLTVKGRTYLPTFLAFFEVFIWFIVAREALNTDINSLAIPIFYSLGYATGTLLGTLITNRFMKGYIGIQAITSSNNKSILSHLRTSGFGVSVVPLIKNINNKKKELLMIQVKNQELKEVTKIIRKHDSDAFVVISESKYVQNGVIR